MSLTEKEIFIDNEFGLVYNSDTKSYKVMRIIPSGKIHGFEKVSELSEALDHSNRKKNDSSKTARHLPIDKRLTFLSLDQSNKIMSDIYLKKDHKDGEFIMVYDEKNRSYAVMRTILPANEDVPNQGTAGSTKQFSSGKNSAKSGKKDKVNGKNESEWVTIEVMAPFDDILTRKIEMRKDETFGHLIHCWQMAAGRNVRLSLVIHTADGPKFIRETDTPNDLSNVDYGEFVVFDLGPPGVYWDDHFIRKK